MLSHLLPFVVFSVTIVSVASKECTNVFPNEYATHSSRYLLQTPSNETWKEEVYSQVEQKLGLLANDRDPQISRRMMSKQGRMRWLQENLDKQIRIFDGAKVNASFLKEVPLSDVALDPDSMYGTAQQTNLDYLLMLDVDDMLWNFRKTAGFDSADNPGEPYGGWEASDCELRGHFVGHFLSASARLWASTKNETLRDKMFKVVTVLSECQIKMGTGYVSAFPTDLFDKFETLQTVWAPYYTVHKIMAGLLDQYTYADSGEALDILKGMVDYHFDRVMNTIQMYSIQRHWNSLNEEVGGMNEVLYSLYALTGDKDHLLLAHLFDKPCFLGELALQADDLSGFHANTHLPLVVGAQRRYEVTGDPLYKDIATYFMDTVTSSHTYATGGTSEDEFWTDPNRLATTLTSENEETCTTYNMLKVARNLFRWTKDPSYVDYYERATINGILPVQRGREPGVMIYMLPLKPGGSKAISFKGWGTPNNTFWCCYGTAIEAFAKLGDSIYFEEEGEIPGLYITQYIPSTYQWRAGGVKVEMKMRPVASWFDRLRVTVKLNQGEKDTVSSRLHLRMPVWTETKTAMAKLNDENLKIPAPGTYLSITKTWIPGDVIELELPMSLHLDAINDDRPEYASLKAILFGPFVLAGLSTGDNDVKPASNESLTDWIRPVLAENNDQLISLSPSGNPNMSFSASSESVRLENASIPGSNEAANATFRLILKEQNETYSAPADAIGKEIMLEPYAYPDMLLAHQGDGNPLRVVSSASSGDSSVFKLVSGLDGGAETVSLQSKDKEGCYVMSGESNSINLGCRTGSSNPDFDQNSSFKMDKGISEYHPISFVARGAQRSFLLVPLLSLRDEQYTVYFNI